MNLTNRLVRWIVASLAVLCLSPYCVQAAPIIKLATLAPKGTAFHQVLLEMGEKWSQAPGGGVKLIVYTDGTLGGEADMVRRMRVGQIQAAMLTATGLSDIDDSVAALQNMPMIFRSVEELEYVRNKLRPQFERKFREKGFIVLFWGDAGWVRFFSKNPGLYPDDFRRMKLFTWAGDSKATDLWKMAGFHPVELQVTDILTGLNTGLIDTVAAEPYYALAGQFYGPAPHMLDIKWAPLVGATVITEKSFNALKPQAQQALLQAADEAGKKMTDQSRKRSEESIQVMKAKHGLQVQQLPPQVQSQWQQLCEEFYPRIRGSIVPAETFDQVRQLLEDYRKDAVSQPASSAPSMQGHQ